MIAMSPNRLVMTRWLGLPLTLLNRIGQPPSMCFCKPGDLQVGIDFLVGLDQVALRAQPFQRAAQIEGLVRRRAAVSCLRTGCCICRLSHCIDF